ncbi:MAG TPA: HD family phosphohydrolase [Spirochaetota bacterium]|nr:HD family phosphohydrolase [Spirochaetota bacterium]HQO02790.1 HD family phosphohydrolase [Spirochaetota bacterium]HQP49852.1 HD family phosphohydrolase [Spirochaetota bacterium]
MKIYSQITYPYRKGLLQEMSQHPSIAEILDNGEFRKLARYRHHGFVSCLDHCIDVALLTFSLAVKQGCDSVSAARGALLHDLFFYDWRTGGPRLHGFRHPAIALANARRLFTLNSIEEDAILRHMWPLTPVPPRYRESMLVCYADKAVTCRDYRDSVRGAVSAIKKSFQKTAP